MRRIGCVLCLALLARAGDDPLVRVYDVADLKTQALWWAAALARVKAAAGGAQVRPEKDTLVVVAPAAVHEGIAKELSALREALGVVVTLDVRLARIEGGAGASTVPAQELEAFLKEKRAEQLARPCVTCWNGQRARLSVVRQVSYVSDFDVTVDGDGDVVVDPVVSIVGDGVTASLRPFATGQVVRVAVDLSISEVKDDMVEVEMPLPLGPAVKIQVPDVVKRSVARLVECKPGAFTVIDLGGGSVLFLMAIQGTAEGVARPPAAKPLEIEVR